MDWLRHLEIACPNCGNVQKYMVEPHEGFPDVRIVLCDEEFGGCDVRFAVETRLEVKVEVHTCTLNLPSTQRRDALEEVATMQGENDF